MTVGDKGRAPCSRETKHLAKDHTQRKRLLRTEAMDEERQLGGGGLGAERGGSF